MSSEPRWPAPSSVLAPPAGYPRLSNMPPPKPKPTKRPPATPQTPPATPVPSPPTKPGRDRFVTPQQAPARNKSGRLIVVGGRGGGVGKSSTAAHMAEMAALSGLRAVCVDEKSQGDLRRRLGFDDERTLLQIAEFWDGDGDTLDEWIVRNDQVKADWIVGPDSAADGYDDDLIPDEMYGRLVDVLLTKYDVVIVDTHPAVRRASSQFPSIWMPRLQRDVRHATVIVSEWDRAKLNLAVEFTTDLLNAGIDSSRVFFLGLLSLRENRGALTFESVADQFRMVQVAQPIPRSDKVADGNNGMLATPMGGWEDPQYERAIRSLMYQVLGDERFAPVEQPRSLWSRLKGGR